MLTFIQRKPDTSLCNYIQGYWLISSGAYPENLDLVPDGYPELFFPLSGYIAMPMFSGSKHWDNPVQPGLIGQASRRFPFEIGANSKILYVKLYPWAPHCLFRIPATVLNDFAVEAQAIQQDPELHRLSNDIMEALDFESVVQRLNTFFLGKIRQISTENIFLQNAVKQIFHTNGMVSVDALNSRIAASRRYVEKIFNTQVGFSPKQYARIIRIKKASILLLDPKYSGQINTIAASLDYYDQSHFLKDFKSVVQQSPSLFMRQQLNFSPSEMEAYLSQWDYS
jgi:AraC-like DNA-binding protein